MSASWFSVSKATLTYILTKLKTVFDTKAEKSFVDIDVYGVFNSVGELDKTTKQATISADSTSDKLEVRPGDAVFFVASAANDSLTISSYDTHYKIVKGTGTSSNQFTLMSADAETDYEEWYTEGTFSLSKSDIGLSNVGNFKAVSTLASQGLSDIEKTNARANIGAGTSNFSGSYNALSDIPSSFTPSSHTHGNIQNGGTLQTNDVAIANGDKLVITDSSDSSKIARASIAFDGSTATKCLTQKGTWENFTNNAGTVTSVKVGNTSYSPQSGVVSLPAYPTTLPASDVHAWAKAASKPSYTLDEVSDGSTRKLANYLPLTGGTLTGSLNMAGKDINLSTTGSSSNDSADIIFWYGSGQEKARIWTDDTYTTAQGPKFRLYKADGTSLVNTRLALYTEIPTTLDGISDGTNRKLTNAKPNTTGSMNAVAAYGNSMGMVNLGNTARDTKIDPNGQTGWHHFINMSYNTESSNMWQTQIAIKAGTTDPWIRSRSGGTISDSTAWGAPWVRIWTESNLTNLNQLTNGPGYLTSVSWNDVGSKPTSFTPSSHTHGNIQNGGTLQTNDITIASGDKLVVTDSSDSSKIARASISFDGSTATKCLTQKGTWATFASTDTLNTVGATNNNSKLYLIGTPVQGPNPISYAQGGCYAEGGKLYSDSKVVINLSSAADTDSTKYNVYFGDTAGAGKYHSRLTYSPSSGNLGCVNSKSKTCWKLWDYDIDDTALGVTYLELGNNLGPSDAGSRYGVISLYDDNGYAAKITPTLLSGSRTMYLPNASGTLALRGDFVVDDILLASQTTINPGTEVQLEVNIYKSGYKPLGVIGCYGSYSTHVCLSFNKITGNTIECYLRSISNVAVTPTYYIRVLYIRNS